MTTFVSKVCITGYRSMTTFLKLSRKEKECTTFAPATIAPMINANVKHNPNPNPNLNPNPNPILNPNPNPNHNLNPYPTLNQKPNHYPHSHSLLSEISSQEQMSDHQERASVRLNVEITIPTSNPPMSRRPWMLYFLNFSTTLARFFLGVVLQRRRDQQNI